MYKHTHLLLIVVAAAFACGCGQSLPPRESISLRDADLVRKAICDKWRDDVVARKAIASAPSAMAKAKMVVERTMALIKADLISEINLDDLKILDHSHIPFLFSYFDADNPNIRHFTVMQIVELEKSERVLWGLIPLLYDSNRRVRHSACICIGKIGKPAKAAVPHLVFGLYSENYSTQRLCAWSIGKIMGLPFPLHNGKYPDENTVKAAIEWAESYYGEELTAILDTSSTPQTKPDKPGKTNPENPEEDTQ